MHRAIVPRNSLSAADAAALRLTFVKYLAQVNDKGEVVRMTARWDDLPPAAKPILEKFVNERLLVRSENRSDGKSEQQSVSIEVAHEAMFRCWDDLKEWLRTSADILRWRRDVQRDKASYPRWTGLRPDQLAVARNWPVRRRDELNAEEVDWINTGILWQRIRGGIVATVVVVVSLLAGIAFRQKAEADQQKIYAQEQAVAAEKARNAAEEALTKSFVRTIGVSDSDRSADERAALWELSELDIANQNVRKKVIDIWVQAGTDYMVRALAHDSRGLHAAIGLNARLAAYFDSRTDEAADRLAKALENPQETDSVRLSSLGDALAALAARMNPNAAASVADGLAKALENTQETDSFRLSSLGDALAALAARMNPNDAASVAARGADVLAKALENPQETLDNQGRIPFACRAWAMRSRPSPRTWIPTTPQAWPMVWPRR